MLAFVSSLAAGAIDDKQNTATSMLNRPAEAETGKRPKGAMPAMLFTKNTQADWLDENHRHLGSLSPASHFVDE